MYTVKIESPIKEAKKKENINIKTEIKRNENLVGCITVCTFIQINIENIIVFAVITTKIFITIPYSI